MEKNALYDLIIVGGGSAGLSAGIYAMRAALKTTLIEKDSTGGQMNLSEKVENYSEFKSIDGLEKKGREKNGTVLIFCVSQYGNDGCP